MKNNHGVAATAMNTMYGGNKFHSGASNYEYMHSKTYFGNQASSLGLSP